MIFRIKEWPGFDEDAEREKIKQHKKDWDAGLLAVGGWIFLSYLWGAKIWGAKDKK